MERAQYTSTMKNGNVIVSKNPNNIENEKTEKIEKQKKRQEKRKIKKIKKSNPQPYHLMLLELHDDLISLLST